MPRGTVGSTRWATSVGRPICLLGRLATEPFILDASDDERPRSCPRSSSSRTSRGNRRGGSRGDARPSAPPRRRVSARDAHAHVCLLAQEVIRSRALVAVTFEAGEPQLQTDQAGLRRKPLPAFDGLCSMSFRCECEVLSKGQVTLARGAAARANGTA